MVQVAVIQSFYLAKATDGGAEVASNSHAGRPSEIIIVIERGCGGDIV